MRFSKRAFTEWLESKPDLTRVGRPENRMHCPLCVFLRTLGAKQVLLSFESRNVDNRLISNPRWARKFQLDACKFVKNDGYRQITAKRALTLLAAS